MLGAAGLAGCATAPPPVAQVGSPTSAIIPGATFHIAAPSDARDGVLQTRLDARLRTLGLTPAETGPRLLFDVTATERPVDVGAYASAEPPPPKAAPEAWLAEPRRRDWWVAKTTRMCAVEVRVWEPGPGREVYRALSREQRRKGDCGAVSEALLDRALAALAPAAVSR